MTRSEYGGQEYGVGCDGNPISVFDLLRQMKPAWMSKGECLNPGYDPRWWHGEGQSEHDVTNRRRAKHICEHDCQVQMTCLEYALEHPREIGVWGGMTERERKQYVKVRRTFEVAS